MIKRIFLTIVLLPILAFAAEHVKIIAHVGSDIITSKDIDDRTQLIRASNEDGKLKNVPAPQLRKQALEMLINEKLYFQEGVHLNLKPSEEEIGRSISMIEEQNNLKPGDFDKFIAGKKLKKSQVLDQIKGQIIWNKIIASRIRPNIAVSDSEVDEAIETYGMKNYDVSLKRIFVPVKKTSSETHIREAIDKLNAYRNKTSGCDSVTESSIDHSFGMEEVRIMLDTLNPNIRVVITRTPIGKFTPVMRGEEFLQTFAVCSKDAADTSFDQREEVAEIIMQKKLMDQAERYLEDLRLRTHITINEKI